MEDWASVLQVLPSGMLASLSKVYFCHYLRDKEHYTKLKV